MEQYQSELNQTIARCEKLNVDHIFYLVQGADNDTAEEHKIFQVFMFGALQYAITKCEVQINEPIVLFKLAYAIQDHIRTVKHEMAKEYFADYLQRLMNSFHGCIQSIVMNPSTAGFSIRNVKYNEDVYAYKSSPYYHWNNKPNGVSAVSYTPLLTQIPDANRPLGQFFVKFENNFHWITNKAYMDRFVDISDTNYVHLPPFILQSFKNAVQITASGSDEENCFIQSWMTLLFVYTNDTKEDSTRRVIFSNGNNYVQNAGYLWNFRTYDGTVW